MRNKTYALLISGIFSVMLIPSTYALEGAGYSNSGQWRPIQGQDSRRKHNLQPGPDPWAGINDYPRYGPQSYNFRPDKGNRLVTTNPKHAYRQPASPAAYAGFPGMGAGSQYRFRPMGREQRRVAPMRWTYRPADIDIPNHYVYRPLKVKRNSNAAGQQRLQPPPMRGMYDYGYKPYRLPFSWFAAPSYESYPYVERNNRYSADRPTGQPMVNRYSYPRDYYVPRYTGQTPVGGHRFRPLNRPGWDGYRYRGQPGRYATNPYPVPNYQRRLSGRDYQYALQPDRYPQMTLPYPGTPQAMGRPRAPNRYGVNWYDGRGDGEGAWYQLAGRQEWPRVSQYITVD